MPGQRALQVGATMKNSSPGASGTVFLNPNRRHSLPQDREERKEEAMGEE